MLLMRAYLLIGLVTHKAVWEVLKRRGSEPVKSESFALRMVKLVKIAILLGVILQTVFPRYVLPISDQPLALQVAGIVLFSAGLATAILGRVQLGESWADIETPQAKKAVVSHGIYGYIRHPIYAGDLLLLAGLELCLNSWLVIGVLALAPVVANKAIREEKMLAENLAGYDAYARKTKRFIPFLV